MCDFNCGFSVLFAASVPVGRPKEATRPGYRINDITSEQLVSAEHQKFKSIMSTKEKIDLY